MEKASEETARRTDEAKKSEEWHAPGFAPGALLANGARGIQYMPAVRRHAGPARMSFGGFNKETERMNEENAEKRRRAKAMAEAERAKDEDVTDAEMASSLGKEAAAERNPNPPPKARTTRRVPDLRDRRRSRHRRRDRVTVTNTRGRKRRVKPRGADGFVGECINYKCVPRTSPRTSLETALRAHSKCSSSSMSPS